MLKANKGDLVRILESASLDGTKLSVGDIVEISRVSTLRGKSRDLSSYYVKGVSHEGGREFWLDAHEFELFRKAGEEDVESDAVHHPSHYPPEVELPPTREQQIRKAAEQLGDLLARKNADYGNSFSEQYTEYGMLSALIRLDDKMRRLKTLRTANEVRVKDEAIADSLLDMAGYALLAYVEETSAKEAK